MFNLNLDNVVIHSARTASDYGGELMKIGAIAGINHGLIDNCTVTGNIDVSFYGADIGLIVGANWSGMILYCKSYGSITGTGILGGIVGISSGSLGDNVYNIALCENHATIKYSFDTQSGCAAGIIGKNGAYSKLDRCKNFGLIKYEGDRHANSSIRPCMAQIVGWLSDGKEEGSVCSGECDFNNLTLGQRKYCSKKIVGRTGA